jgi:quinol monooxygenase YgiN
MADARTAPEPDRAAGGPDDVDLLVVTMTFDTNEPEALLALLSKYVVVSRGHPGCRNIDLVASATVPGRFAIVQKWDSPESQRTHFDSPAMVEMAQGCTGLLSAPPVIDLFEPISAHDLQ